MQIKNLPFFEYDKYNLNSNDRVDISTFVRTNNFAGGFYLDGHASSAGNQAYNQKLSQKRVSSVMNQIRKIHKKTNANACREFW